jgi:hypothetical protein
MCSSISHVLQISCNRCTWIQVHMHPDIMQMDSMLSLLGCLAPSPDVSSAPTNTRIRDAQELAVTRERKVTADVYLASLALCLAVLEALKAVHAEVRPPAVDLPSHASRSVQKLSVCVIRIILLAVHMRVVMSWRRATLIELDGQSFSPVQFPRSDDITKATFPYGHCCSV